MTFESIVQSTTIQGYVLGFIIIVMAGTFIGHFTNKQINKMMRNEENSVPPRNESMAIARYMIMMSIFIAFFNPLFGFSFIDMNISSSIDQVEMEHVEISDYNFEGQPYIDGKFMMTIRVNDFNKTDAIVLQSSKQGEINRKQITDEADNIQRLKINAEAVANNETIYLKTVKDEEVTGNQSLNHISKTHRTGVLIDASNTIMKFLPAS